jgi:NADH-quinone oxidoreductase subunit D
MSDVSDEWVRLVRDFIKGFPKAHGDIARLLNRNRIFIERTKGVGVLTKEAALDYSCTGPVARASGVVRDVRKDDPYLAYADLDFQVICANEGDCYARYLVRMEEMLQSVRLITQALENLPTGPVNVDVEGKAVMPDKSSTYRTIEGLIQHFELVMPNRQWPTPKDEIYACTESPTGELGFYLVTDGTGKSYRCRTRPPGFIHFSVFPHLIEGHQLSDVVAVLGSLQIIAAELDR